MTSSLTWALVALAILGSSNAQLSTTFYSKSCPGVFSTINSVVKSAINKDARMGASLLRLFFHDCFVNGCDGSVLLDDTPTFTGEKRATPNLNSVRGFDVIDNIKSAVERVCPGVVSCADVLAITARDSVVLFGGPYWNVKLGRRDARTASQAAANNSIPPATSSLSALISSFRSHGLTSRDLVALYGAHTIGQARCTNYRAHIYNDSNIDPSLARRRRASCPRTRGVGDNNLAPLDSQTPTVFDHTYFTGLVNRQGLLHSDQELYNGGYTNFLVRTYSNSARTFHCDFATSMIKMGDIRPLTGSRGEIRRNCRKIN
ncbi:hypothetical protein Ancab_034561 [Ancistrocladus abbreviatus]